MGGEANPQSSHGLPRAGADEDLRSEGYRQAIELMRRASNEHGFLATPTQQRNYHRVWGRDSAITSLAALLSEDSELIDTSRRTLETLARYQGPHGEIPSNVDPENDAISYGGTAGRVDADLWFMVACGEYHRRTRDNAFLQSMKEPLDRVRFLLGAWEFNTRGLLYVPPTGDWADEYLQSGYVLYDQLLYLQALRAYASFQKHLNRSSDTDGDNGITRLRNLIRANYWFREGETPDDVYHEVLYRKGSDAAHCSDRYWMPFFSPWGYGYRFDSFANSLALLLDVADDAQCASVDQYIADAIVQPEVMVLPAFSPVITPKDERWDDLQLTFSHTFKNSPQEYHNGGLWPMVTGFYAASLFERGKTELGDKYLEGIHRANRRAQDGNEWSFPEYLHGETHRPGGTRHMSWSAAAAVIADRYAHGDRLFADE